VFIAMFLGPHRPPESDRSSRQMSLRERFLHPAAVPPGLVLLAGTLTFAAFTGFVPLYGEDLGLSGVAPLFALYGVIVVVIRTAGARIPDQLGIMVSGTVAMLFIAAGMLTIGALDSVAGLYLGTAIWALGISVQYPALLVAALADVPDSEQATATSTFTMFFEISGGIGGPLLGITAALASVRATFAVSAVSALIGLVLLRTLVARRLA
jgi:predicted MFS family arabinose efflux permease